MATPSRLGRSTHDAGSMKTLPGFKRTLLLRRARAKAPSKGVFLANERVTAARQRATDSVQVDEAVVGPIRALRKTNRLSPNYSELLQRVKKGLTYRIASVCMRDPNFDELVQSKPYVFMDGKDRVTATRVPFGKYPRVRREDVNYLKHLVHTKA